jgi:hypothetical protein
VKGAVVEALEPLCQLDTEKLVRQRHLRLNRFGDFTEK